MEDQYCGGGYTMTCGPGFLTRFGPHLHTSIGRLYFAGTELASVWSGYINGAIQSGERTARQVLSTMHLLPAGHDIDQHEPDSIDYPPVKYRPDWFERNAPSARRFLHALVLGSLAAFTLFAASKFDSLNVGFRLGFPFHM